jgi:O-antigen/teichoic acid export membrane protein
MTSVGRLARGTLLYGVGQALGRSLTLLLVPVLTRFLEPSAYGILSVLTAFGLLLTTVFSLGLGAAMAPTYFAETTVEGKRATVGTSLVLLVCSTALMMFGGWIFSGAVSRALFGTDAYSWWVVLSVGSTAFAVLTTPFRQSLMFEERATMYVVLSLAAVIVTLVLTVWRVAGLRRGVAGVLEADVLGQGLTCVLFGIATIGATPGRFNRRQARELIALGLPLIPAFGALFVLQHGSRYLLQWWRGPGEVGVYTVGVNLGSAVGLFVSGFQSAWMPYFMAYRERLAEARAVFGKICTYYVYAVGTVSLLLYLFAKPAVMILAAPAYQGAAAVVGLAGTAQFLSGLFLVLLPGIYFAKEVRYLGLVQAAAAATCVVLNIVLLPVLGYLGSAIAVALSYVALNLFQYGWGRRRGYLSVEYERGRLGAFAITYVLAALVTVVPRSLGLRGELLLSIATTLLLIPVFWRLLHADERARIRQWVATLVTAG